MIEKLEFGKSYVFKDLESCIEYISTFSDNGKFIGDYYDMHEGFIFDKVDKSKNGFIKGYKVVDTYELKFFKEYSK